MIYPIDGSQAALEVIKKTVFNDSNFKKQWDSLLPADQVVLSMIADEMPDLHGKNALDYLGRSLGIEDGIDKNTAQNSLRRLFNKNIITKIEYGTYQFEDEAFADWVKYRDQ